MPAERQAPAPAQERRLAFFPLGAPSSEGPSIRSDLSGRPIEQDRHLTRRRRNRQFRVLPAPSTDRRRAQLPGSPHPHRPPARQGHPSSRTRASRPAAPPPAPSSHRKSPADHGRSISRLALTIRPGPGWRIVQTELPIGRTGCFAIAASGLSVAGSPTTLRARPRLRHTRLVIPAARRMRRYRQARAAGRARAPARARRPRPGRTRRLRRSAVVPLAAAEPDGLGVGRLIGLAAPDAADLEVGLADQHAVGLVVELLHVREPDPAADQHR